MCFNHTCHKDSHCHTFTVFNPKLSLSELHPLEGKISGSLTSEVLANLNNAEGQIIDEEYIHKVKIFTMGTKISNYTDLVLSASHLISGFFKLNYHYWMDFAI